MLCLVKRTELISRSSGVEGCTNCLPRACCHDGDSVSFIVVLQISIIAATSYGSDRYACKQERDEIGIRASAELVPECQSRSCYMGMHTAATGNRFLKTLSCLSCLSGLVSLTGWMAG
jgi:hypothetical protein